MKRAFALEFFPNLANLTNHTTQTNVIIDPRSRFWVVVVNMTDQRRQNKKKVKQVGETNYFMYAKEDKKQLGSGSFAKVYLGYKAENGTESAVAIKRMDLGDEKIQQMLRLLEQEIDIMSKCEHANILRLYDRADFKNRLYLMLEYCEGGDLSKLISKKGRLPEAEAQRYLIDLVTGLKYLFEKGFVHRDLKPQNLLLKTNDDGEQVLKIADFGMARKSKVSNEPLLNSTCPTTSTPL